MPKTTDVVVIGAGVVGCSVAYYLAREGVNVIVLEREAIGSGASAHATGSLETIYTATHGETGQARGGGGRQPQSDETVGMTRCQYSCQRAERVR